MRSVRSETKLCVAGRLYGGDTQTHSAGRRLFLRLHFGDRCERECVVTIGCTSPIVAAS